MKLYFCAAIYAKDSYGTDYNIIVEQLRSLYGKGSVVSEHITGVDLKSIKKQEGGSRIDFYKSVDRWIKSSDVFVAEVSFPSSINVGHEMTRALDYEKPVLALYQKGKSPMFLEGFQNDKFILAEYDPKDKAGLERLVKKSIKKLMKATDIRFNFFISPEISRYLDWVAKYKRIPRSVYLRDLIENEMEENTEYKEFKAS